MTVEGREVQALQAREDITPVRVVLAFARGILLPRRAHVLAEFVRELHG
ncbi:hypothetical protein [Microbacterium sp. Root61]|nr:hypothetical protein [Microbacterium sp. Root61]